jgi:hypothetical protein
MPSGDSPVEVAHEATKTALDAFLSADPDRPKSTRTLHIKSLDADVVIREVSDREMETVQQRSQSKSLSAIDTNAEVVGIALVDPDLSSHEVMEKFSEKFGGFVTPADVVKSVMKPFEVIRLGEEVMDLSGAGDDAVTQAKN